VIEIGLQRSEDAWISSRREKATAVRIEQEQQDADADMVYSCSSVEQAPRQPTFLFSERRILQLCFSVEAY